MATRSWVDISRAALHANVRTLRTIAGRERILCAVVKANAYGHGIREVAGVLQRTFQHSQECWNVVRGRARLGPFSSRTDAHFYDRGNGRLASGEWFGIDSVEEAEVLRDAKIRQPILILGYVPIADARMMVRTGARATVAMPETIRALAHAARSLRRIVPVHMKVETGTQRQGVTVRDLPGFVRAIERSRGLHLEGISTHLADVEDTGPDGFARVQLERFERAMALAERIAGRRLLRHASASAGAMLLPDARFDLVRTGISLYGLWPSERVRGAMGRRRFPTPSRSPSQREGEKSKKTFSSSTLEGERPVPAGASGEGEEPRLRPVLTWKTIVGPMHEVPKGAPVGYGCTERVRRRTRIAVLPVGYWDGYDRKLSSVGEVLIRGHRCKVIGRVCMNMIMVDVTDVPRAQLEDEVVLIGRQGRAEVTVDELAGKIGTINYEVVTRINPMLTRQIVA